MHTVRLRVVALLILSSATLASSGNNDSPPVVDRKADAEMLLELEHEWNRAYLDRDTAALERIEADDFVSTGADGAVTPRKEDIGSVSSGDLKVTEMDVDDMKVRFYGDVAVITGRVTMKAKYKEDDLSGHYRWTDVFVNRGGRWQVVAEHESRIAD